MNIVYVDIRIDYNGEGYIFRRISKMYRFTKKRNKKVEGCSRAISNSYAIRIGMIMYEFKKCVLARFQSLNRHKNRSLVPGETFRARSDVCRCPGSLVNSGSWAGEWVGLG